MFTLWQAFLQNVNPLTKVIYAPAVQDQIVEATRDFSAMSRGTAALLFAIYSSAVASMTEDECRNKLNGEKTDLLTRYLAATQQALAAAGFIGSASLVVLQAFTLYLVSTSNQAPGNLLILVLREQIAARQRHAPHALWLLSGIAARTAQRLDLGSEEAPAGTSYFDMQLRRRIWWQISYIDGRASQASLQRMPLLDRSAAPLPANLNEYAFPAVSC